MKPQLVQKYEYSDFPHYLVHLKPRKFPRCTPASPAKRPTSHSLLAVVWMLLRTDHAIAQEIFGDRHVAIG